MQKFLKIILVVAFAAFGVFALTSLPKTNAASEKTPDADAALAPKELYIRNCARCHGVDGKSQTEVGRSTDAPDLTDVRPSLKKSVRVITNGDGEMPAFGKRMKKSEILALAKYIRTL